MLIIDSNVWAYYFDADAAEHGAVSQSLEKAIKREKVGISTVIIMELAHFLIKNLGPIAGREKLNVFLAMPFTIVGLDYELASRAIELLAKYSHLGIGGRDAAILGTAERLNTSRIMTHDQAFKKIDWVNVIDPASPPAR